MLLSSIIFLPMAGALLIVCIPQRKRRLIQIVALSASIVSLALAITAIFQFDTSVSAFQQVHRFLWIPFFGIQYYVGIDGMSLLLVACTAVISQIAMFSSGEIKERIKEYFFFMLLLETGLYGVFSALDLFLWFVFLNLAIISLYFLIGIWGKSEDTAAAMRFLIFALSGSGALLISIIGLYVLGGARTFDLGVLATVVPALYGFKSFILFMIFTGGCLIMMPVFPFHSWFVDTNSSVPTPVAIMLAGLFTKISIYAFLRIGYWLMPAAGEQMSLVLVIAAACNIVYGSLILLAQRDIKKLISYAALVHAGIGLLGIASLSAQGFIGATLHLFNHAVLVTLLLLLAGFLHDRTGTMLMGECGGLRQRMPVMTGFMICGALSAACFPGISSFVSAFLCFLGIYSYYPAGALAGVFGMLVIGIFFLRMIEKVFFGQLPSKLEDVRDLDIREVAALVPLIILLFVLGFYPNPVLMLLNETMINLQGLFQ